MDYEMYNKQIDEMSRAMCFDSEHCNVKSCVAVNCEETWSAERLYNAGYRKQIYGEWKLGCVCSRCKKITINYHPAFCCNCGAKMRNGVKRKWNLKK